MCVCFVDRASGLNFHRWRLKLKNILIRNLYYILLVNLYYAPLFFLIRWITNRKSKKKRKTYYEKLTAALNTMSYFDVLNYPKIKRKLQLMWILFFELFCFYQVQRHFQWNSPPIKYDAFHMIMYELWLRHHGIKYWFVYLYKSIFFVHLLASNPSACKLSYTVLSSSQINLWWSKVTSCQGRGSLFVL